MQFNRHSELEGRHAFLSPSNYHWVRYSDDKFDRVYAEHMTAARGSRLHKLAFDLISERVKLPRTKKTLNMYVNDCIGWHMEPEVMLYYSEVAFGTADAISFRRDPKTGMWVLKISDLKNGKTPTKVTQLEVYAALFCLEYRYKPFDIIIELRIYQNDEIQEFDVDPGAIMHIMDRIVYLTQRIRDMREEAQL